MKGSSAVLAAMALAATLTTTASSQSQQGQITVDQWSQLQQIQADLRASRQALVTQNLPLTDGESRSFWPVYKQYRAEADAIGNRTAELIVAYAANYATMDEPKAEAFFREWMNIERSRIEVREKYVPLVRKVLPSQKAARYFQIENKIDAIVQLGLAMDIPLVPVKE